MEDSNSQKRKRDEIASRDESTAKEELPIIPITILKRLAGNEIALDVRGSGRLGNREMREGGGKEVESTDASVDVQGLLDQCIRRFILLISAEAGSIAATELMDKNNGNRGRQKRRRERNEEEEEKQRTTLAVRITEEHVMEALRRLDFTEYAVELTKVCRFILFYDRLMNYEVSIAVREEPD